MIVRLGTRGSQLALAQTMSVAGALRAAHGGIETEIVIIQTRGDRVLDAPLARMGGKGVFTKEIELALLEGRIDLAVHSLKDLPAVQNPGLALGAVPKRESARDVLVARAPVGLEGFGPGDVIGASSLRRASQLRARRPGVVVHDIRGNVPTRLRKLVNGEYAALVLAEAGLNRLGLEVPFKIVFDDDVMIPAPGQGALGLQMRSGDGAMAELLASLGDGATTACVAAERALLEALGGGCRLPLGANAVMIDGGTLRLRARVLSENGRTVIDGEDCGPMNDAREVGLRLAERLREKGAAELILADAGSDADTEPEGAGPERRVLVTRDEDADGPLSRALRAAGLTPVCIPLIRTVVMPEQGTLGELLARGKEFDGLVITSSAALDALAAAEAGERRLDRGTPVYSVGPATAAKARGAGFGQVTDCGEGREALVEELERLGAGEGRRLLYLRGNLAPAFVAERLRVAGFEVDDVVVYETAPRTENQGLMLQLLRAGGLHGIALCSNSAADAVAAAVSGDGVALPPVITIGPATSEACRERLKCEPHEAASPTFEALAEAAAMILCDKSQIQEQAP